MKSTGLGPGTGIHESAQRHPVLTRASHGSHGPLIALDCGSQVDAATAFAIIFTLVPVSHLFDPSTECFRESSLPVKIGFALLFLVKVASVGAWLYDVVATRLYLPYDSEYPDDYYLKWWDKVRGRLAPLFAWYANTITETSQHASDPTCKDAMVYNREMFLQSPKEDWLAKGLKEADSGVPPCGLPVPLSEKLNPFMTSLSA